MNMKKIDKVAQEAARILRDYPDLKHYQAIALAKEAIKQNKREPTTGKVK